VCDYCDCRTEPEIAALSADHERLGSILAAIDGAVTASEDRRRRELVAELASVLVPHAEREEHGIFQALRSAAVDEHYVARFEADHDEIERLLALADDRANALVLVTLLRDHILVEESDLFPAAHQLLSSSDWAAVEAVAPPTQTSEGVHE
jgi:hemerythrin-like domain-containing protein